MKKSDKQSRKTMSKNILNTHKKIELLKQQKSKLSKEDYLLELVNLKEELVDQMTAKLNIEWSKELFEIDSPKLLKKRLLSVFEAYIGSDYANNKSDRIEVLTLFNHFKKLF